MNLIKLVFNMIWLVEDFKDLARRTVSDKDLSVKHLILLKVLNMMDIKEDLLLCFTNFLIRFLRVRVLM